MLTLKTPTSDTDIIPELCPLPLQVWFQNRRMKDKRQRLAMAWPYGIADPHLYAYIAAAAANYPAYALGSAPHPLGYYPAGLGLGLPGSPGGLGGHGGSVSPFSPQAVRAPSASDFLMAAAASSGGVGGGCLRPGPGVGVLPATHPLNMASLSALGCSGGLRGPVDHPVHLLSPPPPPPPPHPHPLSGSPSSPTSIMAAATALSSSRLSGGRSFTTPPPPSSSSSSSLSSSVRVSQSRASGVPTSKGGGGSNSTAPNGLFRPFQSEVEKS